MIVSAAGTHHMPGRVLGASHATTLRTNHFLTPMEFNFQYGIKNIPMYKSANK